MDQFASQSLIELGLWVVNDLKQPYPGSSLQVSLWRGDELLAEMTNEIYVSPDSSERVRVWKNNGLQVGGCGYGWMMSAAKSSAPTAFISL